MSRIKVVPLKVEHLDAIGDSDLHVFVNDFSWAALEDGSPVAAGGVYDMYWAGRGHCWFTSRPDMSWRSWPEVTRAVKSAADRAIKSGRYRRIEMTVFASDALAANWATILGFKREAFCEKLMPDGSDGLIYARTE